MEPTHVGRNLLALLTINCCYCRRNADVRTEVLSEKKRKKKQQKIKSSARGAMQRERESRVREFIAKGKPFTELY